MKIIFFSRSIFRARKTEDLLQIFQYITKHIYRIVNYRDSKITNIRNYELTALDDKFLSILTACTSAVTLNNFGFTQSSVIRYAIR